MRRLLVLAVIGVASIAASAESAVRSAAGTVIGVAFHSTGRGCLNLKTAAGWGWETHPGGTAEAGTVLKARLAVQYAPIFGEVETVPLREAVAVIVGYDKRLTGSCAPRRMIKVGQGSDSAAAHADAVKRAQADLRSATTSVLGVVRRP